MWVYLEQQRDTIIIIIYYIKTNFYKNPIEFLDILLGISDCLCLNMYIKNFYNILKLLYFNSDIILHFYKLIWLKFKKLILLNS